MQIQALLSPSSHPVPRPARWGLEGTGVFPHRVWDPDAMSDVPQRAGSRHVARARGGRVQLQVAHAIRPRFRSVGVAGRCKVLPVFAWDGASAQ